MFLKLKLIFRILFNGKSFLIINENSFASSPLLDKSIIHGFLSQHRKMNFDIFVFPKNDINNSFYRISDN